MTAEEAIRAKLGKAAPAPSSPGAVISIVVSRADQRIYILENGSIVGVGDAVITSPGEPLGTNVFVWSGGDANGLDGSSWEGMGFHASPNAAVAPNTAVLQRIDGDSQIMAMIRQKIKHGTVLVTTDLPAAAETRSNRDFMVIDGPAS